MKKIILIVCLFSSWVAFTQEEEIPEISVDSILNNTDTIIIQNDVIIQHLLWIYEYAAHNGDHSLLDYVDEILSEVKQSNIYLNSLDSLDSRVEWIMEYLEDFNLNLFRDLDSINTSIQANNPYPVIDVINETLSWTQSSVNEILALLQGSEDREAVNSSNIQSIKDTLENFAPSFDSMVSSLANIESNISYGDINYNNEDLINYLNDNHFDDFYTTFHGYTDSFVPTYLGYMSWSSFGISGNKDKDTLRSWRPESIPYDNFFIQVSHYLDNLANMSANANKSLMMIYDSIEIVETNKLVEAMERKITEIEAQQSALEEAFSAFHELEDNISFEKFEEFVKTGSEGKVNLGSILVPGQFNDELDLGFFPTEWNNRPINVGNLYVRLGVLHEYLLVCRDIFAVVYIFLITIFILWIVRKMLPILSKLFTTLNSIVVWK